MNIDDLLYIIGKLTVEKEMLLRVNEKQADRIEELKAELEASKATSPPDPE